MSSVISDHNPFIKLTHSQIYTTPSECVHEGIKLNTTELNTTERQGSVEWLSQRRHVQQKFSLYLKIRDLTSVSSFICLRRADITEHCSVLLYS